MDDIYCDLYIRMLAGHFVTRTDSELYWNWNGGKSAHPLNTSLWIEDAFVARWYNA